jgi:hypothetical protein
VREKPLNKEQKMIEKTLTILKSKKDSFLDNIKKFNKKAVKLGTLPMEVVWGERSSRSYYADELAEVLNILTVIELQDVTVKYDVPKIAGWDLISIFDYEHYKDENDQVHMAVFTNTIPGKELPFQYQNKTEIHCEHCGHNRYRKQSFLVKHENGEYKEVGSTCLKDFLGHDPSNFLFFATLSNRIKGLEDEFGFGSFGSGDPVAFSLEGVLALTSGVIKKWGWTSRSEAYDTSAMATADMVIEYMNPNCKLEKIEIEEEDREIAKKTIDYFKSLTDQDNDYIMNCLKVIKLNAVPYKRFGIACSMIHVYRRHVEKELEKANLKDSNWFGNIGSKLEKCPVTCTFKTHVDSFYGVSTLYKFIDEDGNVFKTFYSGHTWSVEQGDKVLLSGTVKKHDEWNNVKETLLTRSKVA